jgi:L-alanine-DL-glutamate epimerase-like enolase superfamily enzyme
VHLPIIADEACRGAGAVPQLVNSCDGVNVKLDKCGGILEVKRTIDLAQLWA